MPKIEFQEYLCRPFCEFYKAGIKEELLCRGALLIERLIEDRRLDPGDFQNLRREIVILPRSEADLEALVCNPCPFRPEDCDFQSPDPPDDCRPCGGLIILKQLLSQGTLSLLVLSKIKD